MDLTSILKVLLPSFIFDYFEIINIEVEESSERIDIYLDELKVPPTDLTDEPVTAYGFGNSFTVQDFPIQGKAVYLHLRRRKWLTMTTNRIISRKFDIAYDGTKLTKKFVSFLKDTNRE